MITKTVSETREQLSELLGKVQHGGENVTILRHGKPVAAIVSVEEYAFLERMEDEILAKMGEEGWEDYLKHPEEAISIEDLRAELFGAKAAE